MKTPSSFEIERSVLYAEPMGQKATLTLYISIGVAASLAGAIILYSALTHLYMDKLLANPALGSLTAERFLTILKIASPVIGACIILALAIKVHHHCLGKKFLAYIPKGAQSF